MKVEVFTEKDFDEFRLAVVKWMVALNLTGWRFEVQHEQIGDGTRASVSYNHRAKLAVFRLTRSAEFDFGAVDTPERLALHEVLHLLVADLVTEAAKTGDDMCDTVVSREHELIHRLMEILS